jgi:hypothetical protein
MIKKSPVLLLSGSIVPHPRSASGGRLDPIQRENDYIQAINFYLEQGFRVVFVDNCGTLSEKILEVGNKNPNFEYHCFSTQKSHLGKSQGEVEIINYALENSAYLQSVDYIIKITGRYIIRNIRAIIEGTGEMEHELYINPTRNLRWADSRLMLMKKTYYSKYFLAAVDTFLDESKGVFMENALMKSLFLFLLDGGQMRLWPAYPAYEGIDGTHNEPVTFGFWKRIKYNIYYKLKTFTFRHRA